MPEAEAAEDVGTPSPGKVMVGTVGIEAIVAVVGMFLFTFGIVGLTPGPDSTLAGRRDDPKLSDDVDDSGPVPP